MDFGYRQVIGKLVYAMVICRPVISFTIIKLAQYSTKLLEIYLDTVKDIDHYLNATAHEGIYLCRKNVRMTYQLNLFLNYGKITTMIKILS